MNDKELFIDAINNMPSDVMSAKYDGHNFCKKPNKKGRNKATVDAPFDRTIDLHGYTKSEALAVLRNTLTSARGKRQKILVITGRGNNSEERRGVIREAAINFLEKAGSLYIRRYRFASQKNGGDGALEIFTK